MYRRKIKNRKKGTLHLFANDFMHSHKRTRLDHTNTGTSNSYIPVHKTSNQVVSGCTTFLRNKFNLVVDEENKKRPNIFCTLKLHRDPSKTSCIIAAPQCFVELFSKAVTLVMKLVYKKIETNNSEYYYYSGVKSFFPVQNNQPVIDAIKNLIVEIKHFQ